MNSASGRIPVGILGATGSVGQRFLELLRDHPWFEVTALAASSRSAGKTYREACVWRLASDLDPRIAAMEVLPCSSPLEPRLLFSGLDSSVAGETEEAFANAGHWVISNAKNHRMDPDVPLLIPEINPEHLEALRHQARRRSSRSSSSKDGFILTNPNCSAVGLAMALAPLERRFGVSRVFVATLQAISGAGYPGVAAMDITDNVIPGIGGQEEEKLESEPLKILGRWEIDAFVPASFGVSSHTHRVPTQDGHQLAISVELHRKADFWAVREALATFSGRPQQLGLPSAPRRPIYVLDEEHRPQPRLDRDREGGMAVSVGRLRPCPLLDWRLSVLVHNTIRGAAGAAILNAELARAEGYIE